MPNIIGALSGAANDDFDGVGGFTAEPLTAEEREFLLKYTDLTDEDLTTQKYDEDRRLVARSRLRTKWQARSAALTTADVAKLLGRPAASVRRSKSAGDLYALSTSDGRTLRFPLWQFIDEAVVPGLRDIIPSFARHMDSQSIEQFMTEPLEELNNRSPVEWLAADGDVERVMTLVNELSYE